jgi:hypothetical protein
MIRSSYTVRRLYGGERSFWNSLGSDVFAVMDLRRTILLKHFSRRTFKLPPNGVGLKTMILARDEGLVEIEPNSQWGSARGRLTTKGWRRQQEVRNRSE